MESKVYTLSNLDALAAEIITLASQSPIWIFKGAMGSGKTTLIKAICKTLKVEEMVSSPTFSLVNEYTTPDGPLFHFDFYRIERIEEAYDIGFEEYFYSGYTCLIEWPEKITAILPEHYLEVLIEGVGDERTYKLNLI